jgi:hypothetical protein
MNAGSVLRPIFRNRCRRVAILPVGRTRSHVHKRAHSLARCRLGVLLAAGGEVDRVHLRHSLPARAGQTGCVSRIRSCVDRPDPKVRRTGTSFPGPRETTFPTQPSASRAWAWRRHRTSRSPCSAFPAWRPTTSIGRPSQEDEGCKAATARFNETKCFSGYERSFLVPIFD